eukprot:2604808-Prymnesium_polylepis.1
MWHTLPVEVHIVGHPRGERLVAKPEVPSGDVDEAMAALMAATGEAISDVRCRPGWQRNGAVRIAPDCRPFESLVIPEDHVAASAIKNVGICPCLVR